MDGQRPKYRLHDSIGYHATLAARLVERRVEVAFGLIALGVGATLLLLLSP